MKLMTEIVDLLMNEDRSLTEALLKTKVLLFKLGQPELVGWVNSELTGYPQNQKMPEYRKIRGTVLGTISNGYYTYNNHPVPLGHLTDRQRMKLEGSGASQSLGVIEKMLVDVTRGSSFIINIEPEICEVLSDALGNGYTIQRAWAQFEVSQFRQVLIEVRSRLLDFILELQAKIGDSMNDTDAKAAATKIDVPSMFNGAVIGDNAVFQIMGSQNHQQVSNRNLTGDRNALADALRKSKVSEADIIELDAAIVADTDFPVTTDQYGPQVDGWYKRMIRKSLDGAWEINVGAATGLLTTALTTFFGLAG